MVARFGQRPPPRDDYVDSMSLQDLGSVLQITGGATEVGALIWAARKIDRDLRQRRWAHAKERLDTQVEIIAKAATGDPEGARGAITRFLSEQIVGVYDTVEDVTSMPLRVFIAGIAINVVGVVFAAGWV